MKISMKKHLLTLLAVPALVVSVSAAPVFAAKTNMTVSGGADSAKGTDQTSCLFPGQAGCSSGDTPIFQTITNVLLFIIGAVSVIMLIIGVAVPAAKILIWLGVALAVIAVIMSLLGRSRT